jgi:methylene-tetrahydromethanopterin dehydrogenase
MVDRGRLIMEKPYILHLLTAAHHASPFDVNMACDAGYDVVVPYTDVTVADVTALVQDAIFSRGPKGAQRTGMYIGGRDIGIAADMLKAAHKAMVPPFEVSVFADPSGAFTTAAALVACVERQLRRMGAGALDGRNVVVFGGSGPVGAVAALLASEAGARATIVSRTLAHAQSTVSELHERYGATIAAASMEEGLAALRSAEVVLACGRAGVRLVTAAHLAAAARLLVATDVNAVPPSGVEGVGAMDDGAALAAASGKAAAIGALVVGGVKFQTQRSMLESMRAGGKAVYLGFRDAFEVARKQAS